jgi:hypothetical protein
MSTFEVTESNEKAATKISHAVELLCKTIGKLRVATAFNSSPRTDNYKNGNTDCVARGNVRGLFLLLLPVSQIRFFLLQNKQGKTRLSKWYVTPPPDSERVKMEADVNRVISSRSKSHTNFVEVRYRHFSAEGTFSLMPPLFDRVITVPKFQADLPKVCWSLLCIRGGLVGQRVAANGDHPPVRGAAGPVLQQRV